MDIFDIAEIVKSQRVRKDMTQAELAEAAGLSRTSIVNLENGKLFDIRFGKILSVLNALDLDLRVSDFNSGRPVLEDLLEANSREDNLESFEP